MSADVVVDFPRDGSTRGGVHRAGRRVTGPRSAGADVVLRGVTRRYARQVDDLGEVSSGIVEVSLEIPAGCFAAVTGPSGAGKSTLLNVLSGLDRPDTGSVRVAGVELAGLSGAELAAFRRERLGVVFQDSLLVPELDVLGNVVLPALLAGQRRGQARTRARHLLGRLGLAGLEERAPARLSGGERQRVAVARALVNSPSLLVADEPTGSLDTRRGAELMDLLVELNAEGTTVVVVTHDPAVAERARHHIRLRDGRVVPPGGPGDEASR